MIKNNVFFHCAETPLTSHQHAAIMYGVEPVFAQLYICWSYSIWYSKICLDSVKAAGFRILFIHLGFCLLQSQHFPWNYKLQKELAEPWQCPHNNLEPRVSENWRGENPCSAELPNYSRKTWRQNFCDHFKSVLLLRKTSQQWMFSFRLLFSSIDNYFI